MSSIIKINCSRAYFIDKYNPLNNPYKFNTLITGSINNHNSGLHLFKSQLYFNHIPEINNKKILTAYLFIFINKLHHNNINPTDIGICCCYKDLDYDHPKWDIYKKNNYTPVYHLNIPKNSPNSYIKINVTDIIKNYPKNTDFINFILCPLDTTSQTLVTFNSYNSDNPPYLKIEYENTQYTSDDENINSSDKIHKILPLKHNNTNNIVKNWPLLSYNNELKKLVENILTDLSSQYDMISSFNKNLEESLSVQNSNINSLSSSNLNYYENIINYLTNINDNTTSNLSYNDEFKTIANNILTNLDSQSDIISSFKNDLEENISIQNSNIDLLSSSNLSNYESLLNSINIINKKLDSFTELTTNISAYYNNEGTDSENYQNFLKHFDTLINKISEQQKSIDALNINVKNINEEISNIKSSMQSFSDIHKLPLENYSEIDIEQIINKLSNLNTSLNKISKSIENITIEPLD